MTRLKTALLAMSAFATFGTAFAAPINERAAETLKISDARGEAAVSDRLTEIGYGAFAIDALHEVSRHTSPVSGRTFITYEQRVLNRPVHASYVRAVIETDGALSQIVHRIADLQRPRFLLPRLGSQTGAEATLSSAFGIEKAQVSRREAGRTYFEAGDKFQQEPVAEAVFIADEDGSLAAATVLRTWTVEGNRLVHTLIGENGRVLNTEERTSNDSYVAYAVNPGQGNARVMQGSQADRRASPRGWLGSDAQFSNRIRGNNVEAYADTDRNNRPDGGGSRVTNGVFGQTANLRDDARSQRNEEAAVQNLFYQINVIHDRLYRHGFTETAGNFQNDNFGRGGAGGDHVLAEALDGSGTNNANMAVPVNDGAFNGNGPRMQMYRWTAPNPDRAGSFDADIIWHEYGHGVLWRMVGDLDWPISWALNEGFADALAIVATGEDRVGEWASGRANGIRSARYGRTTKTLGDYRAGRSRAHSNGEIYAAAIWALREEFRSAGRSDDALLSLMIDGLANTKPRATFLDMRDGLLASGGSADDCRVWRAFASVGMGQSARLSWSGSRTAPTINLRESDGVPSACRQQTAAPSVEPDPAPKPSGGAIDGPLLDALALRSDVRSATRWIARATVTVREDGRLVDRQRVNGVWGSGQTSSCVTNNRGRCDMVLWGQSNTSPDAALTITTIDGRRAASAGVPLTARVANPLRDGGSDRPVAGKVLSDFVLRSDVRSATRWIARATVTVREDGRLVDRRRVNGVWGSGQTSSCVTNSQGRCDMVLWGQSNASPDAALTITTIDGQRAVASGVPLTRTVANPL